MIGDNFVVSGIIDWIPNISTTWALACYPQNQCKGGNPAVLFKDASTKGMVSKHCVDYSWCLENDNCNGNALKHFDRNKSAASPEVNLSSLIPSCGCYDGESDHYVYTIEKNPTSIYIGSPGITADNIALTVKKHVYKNGPALGGFLVFNNFMKGDFSKQNGGVYLERGVYGGDTVTFDDAQATTANYKGAHAVVIIGWGVANNILVDNGGKRADVPYWYVRNSWTETWADGGYFKMAMYPWNKISQFEKRADVQTSAGTVMSGGIVFVNALQPPVLKKLPTIEGSNTKIQDATYYSSDPKTQPSAVDGGSGSVWKNRILYFLIPLVLILVIVWYMFIRKTGRRVIKY